MARRITFSQVTFVNNGAAQISVECYDDDGNAALKKSLGHKAQAIAKVQTQSVFHYILRSVKKKKNYKNSTFSARPCSRRAENCVGQFGEHESESQA